MSPFNTPITTSLRPAIFDQAENVNVKYVQGSQTATYVTAVEMTQMWEQQNGSSPQTCSPALLTEKTMNDRRQPQLSMNAILDEIIRFGKQKKRADSRQEKAAPLAADLSDKMDIDDEALDDADHQPPQRLDGSLDENHAKRVRKQARHPPKGKADPSSRFLGPQQASDQSADMEIDDWSMSKELRLELAKRRAVASLTGVRGRPNRSKHHKHPSSRSQTPSESKKANAPPKGPRNTGVQGKKHHNHGSRRTPTSRSHHKSERA